MNWGNGKVYFFKGDEYSRYDIAADKVDAGFPSSSRQLAGAAPGHDLRLHRQRPQVLEGPVNTANLIGDQANIKTRYGKVCCEGTSHTAGRHGWAGPA